jgi:hypothetical protein
VLANTWSIAVGNRSKKRLSPAASLAWRAGHYHHRACLADKPASGTHTNRPARPDPGRLRFSTGEPFCRLCDDIVTDRCVTMSHKRSGLCGQIDAGRLEDTVPISWLPQKHIVLGGQAGSDKIRDWSRRELDGYPDAADGCARRSP